MNKTDTGRITEFTTKVPDKPGSLVQLLQIVSRTGANVMSINHAREGKESNVNVCLVTMVLETRNPQHVDDIEQALLSNGYQLIQH